jgi:predicted dehydrogenase/threonine dehydrogenase-like Zn-dependent dehydrogenase
VKQIVQNARSGKLELADVPAPAPVDGQVLVKNHFSVVSPGTEKMALDFARKSLLGKARSRPDLVKQVVRKLKQEGPLPTYRAVMTRLDSPQALGYSSSGVVEAVGAGVTGFAPGDRVACAGAGYANHAEWISVPENLVARVPGGLSLEKAAFATLGAISLQGLRVAQPTLGEIAVVVGLGLVGQLAVQLLVANGCRVLGIDLDPVRVKQALDAGASWGAAPGDDHGPWRDAETAGHGADLALICAASESSAPIQLAADLCRLKGRVICVGATAMDLDRRSFFEKELDLRMSMSYGPGRYDRRYEELGLDYPIAYVRWTENRNLQAFLSLAASGAIDPERLDVQLVPFADAERTYEELAQGERRSLAVLFRYDEGGQAARTLALDPAAARPTRDEIGVAFLGAGNYAKSILLPAVDACSGVKKRCIATATGPSARRTAEKFGYANCGTDPGDVFADDGVHLAFIATRHDSHAPLAAEALRAGKAVWLEKPAALDEAGLAALAEAVEETSGFLSVGFNRRFSAHARAVRNAFANRRGPMTLQYTVAAGPTPGGTWITDPATGGGRIVGEACHFVDLCVYLVGSLPANVYARALGRDRETDDSTVASIGFDDGSVATIAYLANASSELPKERWEASANGTTAICDNFRTTRILGGKSLKTVNQDKGQATAVSEVVGAVRAGRPSPLSLAEIVAVTRTTFAIDASLRSGRPVEIARGFPESDEA